MAARAPTDWFRGATISVRLCAARDHSAGAGHVHRAERHVRALSPDRHARVDRDQWRHAINRAHLNQYVGTDTLASVAINDDGLVFEGDLRRMDYVSVRSVATGISRCRAKLSYVSSLRSKLIDGGDPELTSEHGTGDHPLRTCGPPSSFPGRVLDYGTRVRLVPVSVLDARAIFLLLNEQSSCRAHHDRSRAPRSGRSRR